jgi:cell division protein FtsI/penicillin-binding protein 2
MLAFVLLAARLVYLQTFRHDELLSKAQLNTQREFLLEPRRGDILDAQGNLLATSVFVKTICADPTLIGNRQQEIARAIAPLLQLDEADVARKLYPTFRRNEKGEAVPNRYIILKRKVTGETWEKIQSALAGLNFGVDEKALKPSERATYHNLRTKAIFPDPHDDQLRVYPNQALAAHVLGFTGVTESEANGQRIQDMKGFEGIEAAMNSKLAGVRGWRVTETDRARREVITLREQDIEARNGLNVVLTLDAVIQHVCETALAEAMQKYSPISATAIVMRPRTGEILAMATLPNFDPNNPGASSADARRNRVIADVAEPGSTFKIVVVSGALNEHAVTLADQFNCENGAFAFAGRVLHDHERYGVLSVKNIITKSSNIGAAKIGIRLGDKTLYDYICDYGFGKRTGVPLPGEVNGLLYPPDKWSKVSIAQIPMGHGIAVTRMQMIMAMCAIANGGKLMRPSLLDHLEDENHNLVVKYQPQFARQVISEMTAREMVEALKTVVTAEGTAAKAALEHYTVAGKTGTAQKAENGVYVPGKFLSSFVGFFPADNPELCISVTLDEPKGAHYGGQTAAPIFKQIAERSANYLNIHPDKGDDGPALPDPKRANATIAARTNPASASND